MIIITGCNGFIGRHLITKIAEETMEPLICLDIDNCEQIFNIKKESWQDISKIYHMGAISDTTETNIYELFRYNIDYSLALFEKAIEYQIPVVYASSAAVYGNGDGDMLNPLNYYAMSKATVDMWVKDNIDKFKDVKGYRFFNVYGEGEENKGNQASPVSKFLKQAKENNEIEIFEPIGDASRDFVWVGDVVRIMREDKRPSGIYDLGTQSPLYFSDVAAMIAYKTDCIVNIIKFPEHLKGKYQRFTQSKDYYPGMKTVRQYLNELK